MQLAPYHHQDILIAPHHIELMGQVFLIDRANSKNPPIWHISHASDAVCHHAMLNAIASLNGEPSPIQTPRHRAWQDDKEADIILHRLAQLLEQQGATLQHRAMAVEAPKQQHERATLHTGLILVRNCGLTQLANMLERAKEAWNMDALEMNARLALRDLEDMLGQQHPHHVRPTLKEPHIVHFTRTLRKFMSQNEEATQQEIYTVFLRPAIDNLLKSRELTPYTATLVAHRFADKLSTLCMPENQGMQLY